MRNPEVFSNPSEVILKRDEQLQSVHVPTSADGGYRGNGEFKNAKGKTFEIITGFDKTGTTEIWFRKGFIKIPKHPLAKRQY